MVYGTVSIMKKGSNLDAETNEDPFQVESEQNRDTPWTHEQQVCSSFSPTELRRSPCRLGAMQTKNCSIIVRVLWKAHRSASVYYSFKLQFHKYVEFSDILVTNLQSNCTQIRSRSHQVPYFPGARANPTLESWPIPLRELLVMRISRTTTTS